MSVLPLVLEDGTSITGSRWWPESVEEAQRKLEAFANDGNAEVAVPARALLRRLGVSRCEGQPAEAGRQALSIRSLSFVRRLSISVQRRSGGTSAPSLQDTLFSNEQTDAATIAQCSACTWRLAKMWQSWGIEPEVVFGCGIGEYAAACVAGVMSSEEGLKLALARDQFMSARNRER